MEITKILIKNFKSIKEIEFDIKKYNGSYTTMLLGVNEVGKSNILKAMSLFNVPSKNEIYDYMLWQNQKDEESEYIDIYFNLKFDVKKHIIEPIKKDYDKENILNFNLENIKKNIYLKKGEKNFIYGYVYNLTELGDNVYIKTNVDGTFNCQKEDDSEELVLLTKENFRNYFGDKIYNILNRFQPKVSFWQPSEEYLISSDIHLEIFKNNPNENIPLKNIFALAGYETNSKILEKINELDNSQKRSKLASILSEKTTQYIKNIWKHKISFLIEISETKNCTISVKDDGKANEHDRHSMSARSEGFKQFISLILSLSIETSKFNRNNRLILIDEPENHLHPSGIRDLSKELIHIGKNNFLFVSTHSPFLIDKTTKERHIIIQKNNEANTIKKEIKETRDLRDDEVLNQAFGINIYKDLLNSKRILVEGASEKIIFEKIFKIESLDYGITNGQGSNIVSVASRFNDDEISMFVITDDDQDGQKYKNEILKYKGIFNTSNVHTLRDLSSSIISGGTIEDCLGITYIQSQFNTLSQHSDFNFEEKLIINEQSPCLEQIKIYLQKNSITKDKIEIFINTLKVAISDTLEIKRSYETKFPILKELVGKIKSNMTF